MREMEGESIDLIVTDPPYFLPVNHYGAKIRLKTKSIFRRNFADLGILEHFFKDVFKEFARIIKPTGRIYIFCDGQSYPLFYYYLYPYCKSVRPLIWDKTTSLNGYSWRHQHELIIFAEMPEAKPVPTGDGDILKFKGVKMNDRQHKAEKPVDLLKELIKKSSNEGDIILDPFVGVGSTLMACKSLGRKGIGIELSPEYCKIGRTKLNS